TQEEPAGSGTAPLPVTVALTGLAANTTYYYRAVASGVGTPIVRGTIFSFTTPSNLAAPVLLTPGIGANNVAYPPSFNWSSVAGATSYGLIVATNSAALPTSATMGTCGAGCVLNVTLAGTS